MKIRTNLVLATAVLCLLAAGCGLQKFPEDRYIDTTPPLPPDGIGITTITPGIAQIFVEWNASTSLITKGYTIFLSDDGGTAFDNGQFVGNVTNYTITTQSDGLVLGDGTQYTVRIRTVSYADVMSEPPDAVQATATTAPAPPTQLTATGSDRSIELTWVESLSNTTVGYYVYILNSTTGLWDHLAYLDSPLATPYPDLPIIIDRDASGTALQDGMMYSFRVTAYDFFPLESIPAEVQNVGIFPVELTNLRATGGDQRVFLTWNPTTNVNADYYIVTTRPINPPGLARPPIQVPASATGYTITGLVNGVLYEFRVQIHLVQGTISPGLVVSATPTSTVDNSPPDDPANLVATPGDSVIYLTWMGSPSPDAVGYELAYRRTIDPTYTYVTLSFVNSYTITNLINGTYYEVYLRTRDPSGNLSLPGLYAYATPGQPSVGIRFSSPGGVYRYNGLADTTVPDRLTLTGTVNGNETAGGTIYYTLDGSNPSTSSSSMPNADTSYIDLRSLTTASTRYLTVKAFFHDSGPLGGNEYGLTISKTYHIFPNTAGTFAPVGGMVEQRKHHTGHLITDPASPMYNQVLLFGGYSPDRALVTSGTELFDPKVEFFYQDSLTPPALLTPRMDHRSVMLDDGKILLVGGRFQPVTNLLADLITGANFGEVFDPVNPLAPTTPVASAGTILHTATLLTTLPTGNPVLICGGIATNPTTGPYVCLIDATAVKLVVAGNQTADMLPGYFIRFTTGTFTGQTSFITKSDYDSVNAVTKIDIDPSMGADPTGEQFNVTPTINNQSNLYNPATNTIGGTPSALPEERFGHAATLLHDGRVFISGGHPDYWWYTLNMVAYTSLIFDPVTQVYRHAGTGQDVYFSDCSALLTSPRFFHTATLLKDGRVLMAGGIEEPWGYFAGLNNGGVFWDTTPLNTTDIYDPVTDTIAKGPPMKTERFLHAEILLMDGRVLVTGGIDFISDDGIPDESTSAEVYNPSTNTFEPTGNMIAKRAGHQMTMLPDGRILVTGGVDNYLSEIYDPISGKFVATAGTLTYERFFEASAAKMDDGKVLITGGQKKNYLDRNAQVELPGPILRNIEILNPDTTIFEQSATSMLSLRKRHSMTKLDDGRILIAGGWGGSGTGTYSGLQTTEIFDPSTGSVSSGPMLSSPRYGHAALKLRGERFYAQGTVTFDGTAIVAGNGTNWIDNVNVRAGDRIRLNSDTNKAFLEIVSVDSATQLTIRAGGGFGFSIPSGTGAYVIRTEEPYSEGTALFTFNQPDVTGVGTNWSVNLRTGDVIRPNRTYMKWYRIASVNGNGSLTLTENFTGMTSAAAEAYEARGSSRVVFVGGNASGLGIKSADVYDPYSDSIYSASSTMTQGRYGHTATLLPNGWVLIVGGASNYDRTAELFDPALLRFRTISDFMSTSGRWTITQAARNNHAAMLMNNGYVFIGGGEVAQNVVEYFDSDTDAAVDGDGDGIAAIDIGTFGINNNFITITSGVMGSGRVRHTLTRVVGNHDAGKAIFTNGSTTVTGVGTNWQLGVNVDVGDLIKTQSGIGEEYSVQAVNTPTDLTLSSAYRGITTSSPLGETYVVGPEQLILVGGATLTAETSGDLVTWDPSNPAGATAFSGNLMFTRKYGFHMGLELDVNGNVILIREHTMMLFFTR